MAEVNTINKYFLDGFHFVVAQLPNSGIFHFEIQNKRGANIERVYNELVHKNKPGKNVFGISHLIEHLSFKTSQDYGQNEAFSRLKNLGDFNAHTSYDEICYYCTTITSKKDEVMRLICNVAFNDLTRIDHKKEFEIEKDVVINEARQSEDDAHSSFFHNMDTTLFGYHPADNIISTPENIAALSLKDCIAVKKLFLNKADHTIIIGYDPIELSCDDEDIIRYIMCELDRYELSDEMPAEFDDMYKNKLGKCITGKKETSTDTDQTLLACFFDNVGVDYYLADIVNEYIQHKSKHSLMNYIREDYGLTYTVSFVTLEKDGEYYSVLMSDVNPDDEELFFKLMKKSLKDCASKFTEEDFEKFIDSVRIDTTLSLTDSRTVIEYAREAFKAPEFNTYGFETNVREAAFSIINSIEFDDMQRYMKQLSKMAEKELYGALVGKNLNL